VAHKCNAQNKIPLHKTKSHYTKQNSTTQNKIPLHKTKFTIHKTQFHNTKLNFATQNKIPLHETKFHYTKLNSTTQNSIPLHKTQFTMHNFHGKARESGMTSRSNRPWCFFLLRHLTVITMQRKIKFKAMESRFNK
jgi:hypothetical protein